MGGWAWAGKFYFPITMNIPLSTTDYNSYTVYDIPINRKVFIQCFDCGGGGGVQEDGTTLLIHFFLHTPTLSYWNEGTVDMSP